MIMIFTYILFESFNVIYTSKFGFKTHFYQPYRYVKVRLILMTLKYITGIIVAFSFFSTNLLIFLIILIAPFIVDFLLFKYCVSKEKKRLIKFYSTSQRGRKPMMNKERAKKAADNRIDSGVKNNEYKF